MVITPRDVAMQARRASRASATASPPPATATTLGAADDLGFALSGR